MAVGPPPQVKTPLRGHFFAAGPSQGKKRPLGGMSPDTEQSLRTVLCLANPGGMQAARWRASRFSGEAWGPFLPPGNYFLPEPGFRLKNTR